MSFIFEPVNDAPEVKNPTKLGTVNEDESLVITQAQLLENASDIENDKLQIADIKLSSGEGKLVSNGDDSWTFTPSLDWNGEVSFSYSVSDGHTKTETTANLVVNPVDDLRELEEGKGQKKFKGSSNTRLFQFEDSKAVFVQGIDKKAEQVGLTNPDRSPYIPQDSQTVVAAEKDADGNIQLLSWREAGEITRQVTELQTKQVTETVTDFITEQVTDYITKTLYRTVTVSSGGGGRGGRGRGRGRGGTTTQQVPYTVQEEVIRTISTPVQREVTRNVTVEVTRDISFNVQKEVTTNVEAGFLIQTFDADGNVLTQSTRLDQASNTTYNAELLFNLDLNNDNVQGRNIQSLDESTFHTQNKLSSFKGSNSTNLLQDANSKQLLVAPASNPNQRVELTNADGSPYTPADNHTVVAAEADASGNINLLSWNQATNSFNLQLFGANGTLTGSPLSLTKGAQATYDAEFLFNLDLNNDNVQGRNIQSLDESTFHTQNKLSSFKGSNSTNLLQDANSKQLLVAPASNPNQRVELTNADGSPYTPADNHTVVAAEADASGNINLLSWNQATNSFNLQLFGANGTLTGSPLSLTKGAQATYDAEFLFNLDLNSDNVQGRNTSLFDETKYHNDNKLTAFKQNSNTDLHLDINSGELLTTVSGQRTPKTILSNSDGSSFLPSATQTVVAAEKDANGNIQLLSWQKAGQLTHLITEQHTKQITELQTKQVTETVTEFDTQHVTDYVTKTLYRSIGTWVGRGRNRRWTTQQVPYSVTEEVIRTISTPVERQVTRDVTVEVTKNITEQVEAHFSIQTQC